MSLSCTFSDSIHGAYVELNTQFIWCSKISYDQQIVFWNEALLYSEKKNKNGEQILYWMAFMEDLYNHDLHTSFPKYEKKLSSTRMPQMY